MTCIVGLIENNELWMGSDIQGSDTSGLKLQRKDEKIFKKGSFLISFCGSYRLGQLIRYEFEIPSFNDEDAFTYMVCSFVKELRVLLEKSGVVKTENNIISLEGSLLCGFYDSTSTARLFTVNTDLQVSEYVDNYASEGSGSDFALASLFTSKDNDSPQHRIELALKCAAYYNCYVGDTHTILTL